MNFIRLLLLAGAMVVTFCSQAQVEITGKIVDEDNNPMPGVNVVVKGTNNGTVTDGDGAFKITVPSTDAILTVSFVGYTTVEVATGSQTQLLIQLGAGVTSIETPYYCCTDHKPGNGKGPHCDEDQKALTKKFGCKNFVEKQ